MLTVVISDQPTVMADYYLRCEITSDDGRLRPDLSVTGGITVSPGNLTALFTRHFELFLVQPGYRDGWVLGQVTSF